MPTRRLRDLASTSSHLPSSKNAPRAAICALQNVAIIGMIFKLGTVPRGLALALTAALAAAGWWLLGGACPEAALTALQTGSVALLALGGRMPQIALNVRRGNSGELSLLSCLLSFVGNLMRVFTTATLVGDPLLLASASTQVRWVGDRRVRLVCGRVMAASASMPNASPALPSLLCSSSQALLNGILTLQCVDTMRQLKARVAAAAADPQAA